MGLKEREKQLNVIHLVVVHITLSIPARIFPIYFPFGNMATGFFIIFSLIAGVVGFITSVTGITNIIQSNLSNLHAAAASSLITWSLTLLAMGEKDHWRKSHNHDGSNVLVKSNPTKTQKKPKKTLVIKHAKLTSGYEKVRRVFWGFGFGEFFIHEIMRSLETLMIILSGTQLFCMGTIHVGVEDVISRQRIRGGRV
ncbi:unnamed protein product [Ilex paraguariensis]|uniref:Uncharacterized protein n=1 Tax=Ilex paraguariensis TaxID=185542 RepID=A0ABC8UIL0_9AQUA